MAAGLAPTRYGFPSGNSSAAPIDQSTADFPSFRSPDGRVDSQPPPATRLPDLLSRVLVPLVLEDAKVCLLKSSEAEYFGAMMAARDLIFVRDLLIELAHLHDIGRKGSRSYVHLRVSHGVSFIRGDQGLLWAVKQTKM